MAGKAVVRHIAFAVRITVRQTEGGLFGAAGQGDAHVVGPAVLEIGFPVVFVGHVVFQRIVDAVRSIVFVVLVHLLTFHRFEGRPPRETVVAGVRRIDAGHHTAFVTVGRVAHTVLVLKGDRVFVNDAPVVGIVHFDTDTFAGFTALGGDHDGAVGTAGAVQ